MYTLTPLAVLFTAVGFRKPLSWIDGELCASEPCFHLNHTLQLSSPKLLDDQGSLLQTSAGQHGIPGFKNKTAHPHLNKLRDGAKKLQHMVIGDKYHRDPVFQAAKNTLVLKSCADSKMYLKQADRNAPHFKDRSTQRVLLIGPGFGTGQDAPQFEELIKTGYEICVLHFKNINRQEVWADELQWDANVEAISMEVKRIWKKYPFSVLMAASNGGAVLPKLWDLLGNAFIQIPTVLINFNPYVLNLGAFDPRRRLLITHGDRDRLWGLKPRSCKVDIEGRKYEAKQMFTRVQMDDRINSWGTYNVCLFLAATSGTANGPDGRPTEGCVRFGDAHNMASLKKPWDTFGRLLDAAVSKENPLVSMLRSGRDLFITKERRHAEQFLGLFPHELQKLWMNASPALFNIVSASSIEAKEIVEIFMAKPGTAEGGSWYPFVSAFPWPPKGYLKIERIQNGLLLKAASDYVQQLNAKYKTFKSKLNVEFEPGVHSRWLFHGAPDLAIENIAQRGFIMEQRSGRAKAFGQGQYFARDARYVVQGLYGQTSAGQHSMLLCLVSTGMPTVADETFGLHGLPQLNNIPFDSTVDSLFQPEIHVLQNRNAIYPAYRLTYLDGGTWSMPQLFDMWTRIGT